MVRAAMAAGDAAQSSEYLGRAIEAVEKLPVPSAAWRVHLTAAAAGRGVKHLAEAKRILEGLADSLPEMEPLRESILSLGDQRLKRKARK
jgi:hypothetical protein